MNINVLVTAAVLLLARIYAQVTPITDLGALRIPLTCGIAAVVLLAALAGVLYLAVAEPRPVRRGRTRRTHFPAPIHTREETTS